MASNAAHSLHHSLEYVTSSGGVDEYLLKKNGLRVLLLQDHTAPVLTLQVTYHVGSRNEAIGYTGATHLLEHLMFKGAKEYNKEAGKNIWNVLQRVGAQINATTWLDRTNYYELLPSEYLEEAMKIEADRMRDAFIREEDRAPEMTVVRNEFERGENEPASALRKEVWAAAFMAHPYHHPTIGWQSDIEKVPIERLREFYHQFYWPNNATLAIVGDFKPDAAAALIDLHFGKIPRSPHPIPPMYTAEPPQTGPRRVVVKRAGAGATLVLVAHKTPPGLHPDTAVLRVLQKVLSYGKNARLYRALQDKGLVSRVHVGGQAFRDGGLLETIAYLTPGTDADKVERIIMEEYEVLKEKGITEEELQRVKSQIRTEAALARDGSLSVASKLNEAIALGDWKFFTSESARIEAVTVDQVKLAAQAYLVDHNMTVGRFLPRTGPAPATPAVVDAAAIQKALSAANTAPRAAAPPKSALLADRCAQLTPLPGLQVLVMPTSTPDVVAINGVTLGGTSVTQDRQVLARVLPYMLDLGTKRRSKFEVSERLEAMGATIMFWPTEWHLNFSARCLSKDVPAIMEILAEELREPLLAPEDLETVRKRLQGELELDRNSTRQQADIAFSRLLYPRSHANYQLTTEEELAQLKAVTIDDVVRYHAQFVGRSAATCIAAAGDITPEAFSSAVVKHFASLPFVEGNVTASPVPGKAHPTPAPVVVRIEEKKSADVMVGLPIAIHRHHADWYPLVVANYILGGNFSARLNQVVRDQKGLTYGIRSAVETADAFADGQFHVWATFSPQKLPEGLAAVHSEVARWLSDGVTEKELADVKTTLIGTHAVGLADSKGFASNLITNFKRGWPVSFLDDYVRIIRGLTLQQVNDALRKYVHADKLTTVVAGTVDEAILQAKI